MNKSQLAKTTLLGVLALVLGACTLTRPYAQRHDIGAVLTRQADAWNHGDIPAFMQDYWHSDSLVIIGRRGITYGWQPVLDNYRRNYPDAAAMGQLTFSELHITPLGVDAAHVVGKWHLTRPAVGDVQGQFLLVFRRLNGKWVIVADHTS